MEVKVDGLKDAFDITRELLIPYQREEAKRRVKLENALRQAEIQRLNAEILSEKARTQREIAAAENDRATAELTLAKAKQAEADARLTEAQAEKTFVEAEKERESMRIERIKLAEQLVQKYNPEITGPEKINYILRLLPDIDKLLSGGLDLIE